MKRMLLAAVVLPVLVLAGALVMSATQSRREPPYVKVAEWGGAGEAPGRFHDPTGIAVAGDRVFVADARNSRIQVFSVEGVFLYAFPEAGDAITLGRPMNLDISGNHLFVADYDRDEAVVFTLDGDFVRAFGASGEAEGLLDSPSGIAALADGGVVVVDFYGRRFQSFDAAGSFRSALAGGRTFIFPSDVAVRPDGGLVFAEGYAHRLHLVSPEGVIERSFGGFHGVRLPGMGFPAWFKTVSSIAVDPQGRIAATDFYNGRVQVFDARGYFLTNFGEDDFDKPFGIAAGEDGRLYVVDTTTSQVSVWRRP